MIRVLVADDQAAVRDGFAALITAQADMTVAAPATVAKRSTSPDARSHTSS
jgi:DNA-binding NarL/FixJ family response regulator